MKLNPIGGQIVTTPKQEPIHYVNTRGRQNQQYNQNNQRGRGDFRGRPYPPGSQNTRVNNINNNETQNPNNVSNVEISMARIIYNLVRQKTKIVQNAQNADILQKFAVLQT